MRSQIAHIKQGIVFGGFALALVVAAVGSLLDGHAVEARKKDSGVSAQAGLVVEKTETFFQVQTVPIINFATTSSTNIVSGLESPVVDVNVRLTDLRSTVPSDLDVLLVGPGGQMALVMSDMGADNPVSNVTLTLDDNAANQLSPTQPLKTGTFQPANFGTFNDSFDSPPAPPIPTRPGTRLGVFNGIDPNGTWRLFVRDAEGFNNSSSAIGGWSLIITVAEEVPPPTPTPTPVNGAPAAAADSFGAQAGKPLAVAGPGVLGNDSDPNGDALTAILAGQPRQGTVALQADGSFTYTAKKTAKGTDSFTYLAQDPDGRNALATVDIQIKKKKQSKGKGK